MKKITPLFLLIFFLVSCSGGLPDLTQLLLTATPVPVSTDTPQPTVTLIPTQDLFATATSTPITFTPTDTPLVPDQVSTNTPAPQFTVAAPFINVGGGLITPGSNVGFRLVKTSSYIVYWDAGPCSPRDIKFTVFVTDTVNTSKVLLFLRLREKANTLNLTKWGAGAEMLKGDDGSYSYDVSMVNINLYYYFIDAWLEYQLVALNENHEEVGRTQVFDKALTLARCGGPYKK